MSSSRLGGYLLQHSGLTKIERLLIPTTTKKDADLVADSLLRQHSFRHLGDQHHQEQPQQSRWTKKYTAHYDGDFAENHPATLDDNHIPSERGYEQDDYDDFEDEEFHNENEQE